MRDEFYCENCGRETTRINYTLELPSCCVECDNDLQDEISEAINGSKD